MSASKIDECHWLYSASMETMASVKSIVHMHVQSAVWKSIYGIGLADPLKPEPNLVHILFQSLM